MSGVLELTSVDNDTLGSPAETITHSFCSHTTFCLRMTFCPRMTFCLLRNKYSSKRKKWQWTNDQSSRIELKGMIVNQYQETIIRNNTKAQLARVRNCPSGRADCAPGRTDWLPGHIDCSSGRTDCLSGRTDCSSGRTECLSGRTDCFCWTTPAST